MKEIIDIEKIRRYLESFAIEKSRELYLNRAGLKENLEISTIYDKYCDLFRKENILEVKNLRKKRGGEEERKLRYLQQFLTDEYLGMVVKELTDKKGLYRLQRKSLSMVTEFHSDLQW